MKRAILVILPPIVVVAIIGGSVSLDVFALERYVCYEFMSWGHVRPDADARSALGYASPQFNPQWSPDGSRIAFATGPEPTPYGQIFVVASDGSSLSLIAEGKSEADFPYPVAHSPSFSPDGTLVAYSTSVDLNYLIETSTLDGLDRRTLTNGNVIDFSPEWSPGGSQIAFLRRIDRDKCGRYQGVGVFAVGENGQDRREVVDVRSGIRQLNPTKWGASYHSVPKWSPDGELLAYVVNETERVVEDKDHYYRDQTVLYTANTDGSELRRLHTFSGRGYRSGSGPTSDEDLKRVGLFSEEFPHSIVSAPAWSPDGQRLAFVGAVDVARWSPDGHRLAFGPAAYDVPKLYTINRDGSDSRELVELERSDLGYDPLLPGVFWSSDGTHIMFSLSGTLYLVNAEGTDLRSIDGVTHFSPSPDGSRVAVVSPNVRYRPPSSTDVVLFTMALDGSDRQVLVRRDEDGNLELTSK